MMRLISAAVMGLALGMGANAACAADDPLGWRVTVESPVSAPEGGRYWFQARAGVVLRDDRLDRTVLTAQLIDSQGTHMYHGLASMWSDDRGRTWHGPTPQPGLDRHQIDGDLIEVPVDMTPLWHRKTGRLLMTGATFLLSKKLGKDVPGGGSFVAYAVYDAGKNAWNEYRKVGLPDRPDFGYARAGCTQAMESADGEVLLPIYFGAEGNGGNHKSTVLRCRFDGETLTCVEQGDELSLPVKRGLNEPSLTKSGDVFYLTMRNDDGAYLATSPDGLHFGPLQKWMFDDGKPLESCNTQQHWVTHSDGLFLAYTRKHADNDEVFRNRAPLFMARVDP